MDLIQNWPYKWFGLWKEQGKMFRKCPSVYDFIRPDLVGRYRLNELRHYLDNSTEVSATSGMYMPDPFTGEEINSSVCYMTDGDWLWLDTLPYLIEKYHIAIPKAFIKHIEKNRYKPVSDFIDFDLLDWPSKHIKV